MKLFLTFLLFTFSISVIHAVTPLDLKLGYWEYKIDIESNPMMKQAIASLSKLPKEQRDQIMKKMGAAGGFKKMYHCFTTEDMKNWEQKIAGKLDTEDCKMIVKKSTKKIYLAKRKCNKSEKNIEISIIMKDNKEGESIVTMPISSNPIKTEMKWVSSTCPTAK